MVNEPEFDVVDSLGASRGAEISSLSVIADFLAAWDKSIGPSDGIGEDVLNEVQRQLGIVLPRPLHEFYQLLGGWAGQRRHQDTMLGPEDLRVVQDALVFREENQRLAYWGVPIGELTHDDPSVVWSPGPGKSAGPWQPYSRSLSMDLVEYVIGETMLMPGARTYFSDVEGVDVAQALDRLEPLALPEHVLWAQPDAGKVRWFGLRDTIVRYDGGLFLWASCRLDSAVDELRSLIPVEWEPMAE